MRRKEKEIKEWKLSIKRGDSQLASRLDLDLCLPNIATGVKEVRNDDIVHGDCTVSDTPLDAVARYRKGTAFLIKLKAR